MTIIKGDFGCQKKKAEERDGEKKKRPAPLYQFHVSLAFSDPLIWRRILVPGELTLEQLHKVLQLCMGWSGECNHQFYVGKIFYNMGSGQEKGEEYHEADYDLLTLEEAMKWCFTYIYDAGDGWEHEIILEKAIVSQERGRHPQVLDGERAAPPENIGSVHGYAEFLGALENPGDESGRRFLRECNLTGFDPHHFDRPAINRELKKLIRPEG